MRGRRVVPAAAVAAAGAAAVAVVLLGGPPGGGPDGSGDRPLVFAASSLRDALPAVAPHARYSFAGSNTLAVQIARGARPDVFVSASPRETSRLVRAGLIGRPRPLARNRLVVVVPRAGGAPVGTVADLGRAGVRTVLAAPSVPAGAYTRSALRTLGVAPARVVSLEPDVRGVLAKVAIGEADAGVVYATDARAAAGRVRTVAVPDVAQPDIRYEIAVVTSGDDPAAGRALVAAALGPSGRAALHAAGFLPAGGGG
jgi:molybdate transport system substrate-binding protein